MLENPIDIHENEFIMPAVLQIYFVSNHTLNYAIYIYSYLWGAVLIFLRYFLISKYHFLISKIRPKIRIFDIRKWFFDFRNSNSWYKKITVIFWYQEIDFLISENHFLISKMRFFDIKKWFSDITKYVSFSDIKNNNFWYQKFTLLI